MIFSYKEIILKTTLKQGRATHCDDDRVNKIYARRRARRPWGRRLPALGELRRAAVLNFTYQQRTCQGKFLYI